MSEIKSNWSDIHHRGCRTGAGCLYSFVVHTCVHMLYGGKSPPRTSLQPLVHNAIASPVSRLPIRLEFSLDLKVLSYCG